jgi:hypothetical protein
MRRRHNVPGQQRHQHQGRAHAAVIDPKDDAADRPEPSQRAWTLTIDLRLGAVGVLTSSPPPAQAPAGVVTSQDGPAGLLEQLRHRGSDRDVHLIGGPRTIRAFHELGALDRGTGHPAGAARWRHPLSLPGAPPMPLRLVRNDRTFPDGSVELVYAPE